MKNKYPYCYSVAYRNSSYFRSHAFKVREDKEFVTKAFESNDFKTLDFMENFYKKLLKDRACEKDISSKFSGSLVQLEEADKLYYKKSKKVKLEE